MPAPWPTRAALLRLLAGMGLCLGCAGAAWSHAKLLVSVPGNGQQVATAPTELRLRFNEAIEPGFSRVEIVGADGKPVVAGKLRPADGDDHSAVVPLQALPSGSYSVKWSAMGRDGHRMKGSFSFGVK